jgi:adhesin transport system membrane fusion protein
VLVGFYLWATWATIDQITRAPGQVITISRNQVIQAPDTGVLDQLLVKEGDKVRRGQVLFRFDQTRARAAYQEGAVKSAALKAALARLQAELYGGEPKFPRELDAFPDIRRNQTVLFGKRQDALKEEIAALERSLGLVRQELDMNLPLLKSGDVSRAEILKLQRQVSEIQGQITNRRNKYLQDAQAELAKAEEDLASVSQIIEQRREQLDLTEIRAPMDGVVRNVRLTTLGGVAKPGDEILQIVPMDDALIIEAKMRPADVAFVKPGLPATVKLDAYDYAIYGALQGEVTYISADTLVEQVQGVEQPYYRVQIRTTKRTLNSQKNERIEIQPGMTAIVEVRTGSHTIWRYLTKPITKTIAESLGER